MFENKHQRAKNACLEKRKIHTPLNICGFSLVVWLLVSSFFIHDASPSFFFDMDGYAYAAIAHNMAHHIGSIWRPHYAQFRFHQFYEHPALGLYLESLYFRVLGDHWYSVHFFNLTVYLATMAVIYCVWKEATPYADKKLIALPFVLWLLFSFNTTYYTSNYLEPVAGFFSLCSVLALLYSLDDPWIGRCKTMALLMAAALCLCLAVLCNGPVSLFVLGVDLAAFVSFRQRRWTYYLGRTAVLLLLFSFFLLVFFYISPGGYHNFMAYMRTQVVASLLNNRTNSRHFGWHRFDIVIWWLINATLVLSAVAVFSLWVKFYLRKSFFSFMNRNTLFYFLITLGSLLPIMLSSKQFAHYSLQSNIFFMMCVLTFITEPVSKAVHGVSIGLKWYRWSLFVSCLLLLSSFIVAGYFFLIPQNFKTIQAYDAARLFKIIGHGGVVSVPPNYLHPNPYLIESILQRNYGIGILPRYGAEYLMVSKYGPHYKKGALPGYQRFPFPGEYVQLYKKTACGQ